MGEVIMNRRAQVTAAAGALLLVAAATYLGLTMTSRVEPGSVWYGLDDASGPAAHPFVPGNRLRIAVSVRTPVRVSITLDGTHIPCAGFTPGQRRGPLSRARHAPGHSRSTCPTAYPSARPARSTRRQVGSA